MSFRIVFEGCFLGGVGGLGLTVNSPRGLLKGIPALIVLKPCSNFMEFTVGLWT